MGLCQRSECVWRVNVTNERVGKGNDCWVWKQWKKRGSKSRKTPRWKRGDEWHPSSHTFPLNPCNQIFHVVSCHPGSRPDPTGSSCLDTDSSKAFTCCWEHIFLLKPDIDREPTSRTVSSAWFLFSVQALSQNYKTTCTIWVV